MTYANLFRVCGLRAKKKKKKPQLIKTEYEGHVEQRGSTLNRRLSGVCREGVLFCPVFGRAVCSTGVISLLIINVSARSENR